MVEAAEPEQPQNAPEELKLSLEVNEPQEGKRVYRVYWMQSEKAVFLSFDSFEDAKRFYAHFTMKPCIFCMTGNEILQWSGDRQELNTLVDFIFLDGFI